MLRRCKWKANWNGGQWNDWEVLNNPDDYKFYAVSSNEIHEVHVVVKEVSGVVSETFKFWRFEK